jgi:hypothetical protein
VRHPMCWLLSRDSTADRPPSTFATLAPASVFFSFWLPVSERYSIGASPTYDSVRVQEKIFMRFRLGARGCFYRLPHELALAQITE